MEPNSLENRVAVLERQMHELRELPGRVASLESEFLQFRLDVKAEFSAIHLAIRTGDEETRRYMRVLHEEVLTRIALLGERWNSES